jgi:hypothetical protein
MDVGKKMDENEEKTSRIYITSGRSEPVCAGMQYRHWFIMVGGIPPKSLYYQWIILRNIKLLGNIPPLLFSISTTVYNITKNRDSVVGIATG